MGSAFFGIMESGESRIAAGGVPDAENPDVGTIGGDPIKQAIRCDHELADFTARSREIEAAEKGKDGQLPGVFHAGLAELDRGSRIVGCDVGHRRLQVV